MFEYFAGSEIWLLDTLTTDLGGNVLHVDAETGDYYNWYYMFSNNLVALAYVGTQEYKMGSWDTMVDWYFIIDWLGYVYLLCVIFYKQAAPPAKCAGGVQLCCGESICKGVDPVEPGSSDSPRTVAFESFDSPQHKYHIKIKLHPEGWSFILVEHPQPEGNT